jgi:hypothetical protein
MPDPKRLINTLHRAAGAFRTTAGRRGRYVRLEGVTDVLVGGDLHGNVENFRRLVQKANLRRHTGRHLVLQELVHGPFRYPDGGDKSHQLLDLAAALKCEFPQRVHVLLGNHELAQWTGQWIAKDEVDLNELFLRGVNSAYGTHAGDIFAAYRELLSTWPLALRTPNRVLLCHSLPPGSRGNSFDPTLLEEAAPDGSLWKPGGALHSFLWGRDIRPEAARAFLARMDADLLITGHIPCPQGFMVPNEQQIILDCLGAPACYCLFPADRPLTHAELLTCVHALA